MLWKKHSLWLLDLSFFIRVAGFRPAHSSPDCDAGRLHAAGRFPEPSGGDEPRRPHASPIAEAAPWPRSGPPPLPAPPRRAGQPRAASLRRGAASRARTELGGSRECRRAVPRPPVGLCRGYQVGLRGGGRSGFGLRPSGSFTGGGARSRLARGLPRVGSGGTAGGAARGWALLCGSGCFGCRELTRRFVKVNATCPVSEERVLRPWNIWGWEGREGFPQAYI